MKINRAQLQGDRGLRVAVVPANEGKSDKIYKDERRNLVVCPLPYDGSFVETFYKAWEVVARFFAADAQVPKEVALSRPRLGPSPGIWRTVESFPSSTS